LAEASRHLGVEGATELAYLQCRWEDLAGSQVAAHSRPAAFEGGRLTVVVDQSAWAVELQLLSAQLLERVRSEAPAVRTLLVRVSPRGSRGW